MIFITKMIPISVSSISNPLFPLYTGLRFYSRGNKKRPNGNLTFFRPLLSGNIYYIIFLHLIYTVLCWLRYKQATEREPGQPDNHQQIVQFSNQNIRVLGARVLCWKNWTRNATNGTCGEVIWDSVYEKKNWSDFWQGVRFLNTPHVRAGMKPWEAREWRSSSFKYLNLNPTFLN